MGKKRIRIALACAVAAAAAAAGCAQEPPDGPSEAITWARDEAPVAGAGGEAPGGAIGEEPAAQDAPQEAAGLGATDARSELHSSATAFDTSRAWPLSREGEVASLIGEDAASGLLGDLNGYLAPAGIEVGSPLDVMVSEDGVRRAGPIAEFRILAYHAADRIVIDCAYDGRTGRHEFARLP